MKFCWHKWGRWSEAIEDFSGSLHQVCACEKCNAIKRRKAISIMAAQLEPLQVNSALARVEDARGEAK